MKTELYRTDGIGGLKLLLVEAGDLGPTSVRIDVAAASLNFRDLSFVRGNEFRRPADRRIPLSDAVGVVTAIGSDVTRVAVGERVCPTILPRWIDSPLDADSLRASLGSNGQDGVLSRSLVVEQSAVVKMPEYLTDLEAATLPTAALTAWHALVEVEAVRPGDTIVIETTGGVATFALQIAVALGMKAIVTSRSDAKLERARELGAWQTINSEQVPAWDQEVLALTGGHCAQLIVDMGLREGLVRSCRAAAYAGTVAIVGVLNSWQTTLDIGPVMNKNLRVRGVETGSRAMFERIVEFSTGRSFIRSLRLLFRLTMQSGRLRRSRADRLARLSWTCRCSSCRLR